jgi:uncharacterized membrane protein YidH (DUF202 family)
MIVTGAVLTVLAMLHYVRTGRAIASGRYQWSPVPGAVATLVLVVAALVLCVYLLIGE